MNIWIGVVVAVLSLSVREAGAGGVPESNPWRIQDTNAWINFRAVEHPWRKVDGKLVFVPRAADWFLIYARVVQVMPDGLLIQGVPTRGGSPTDSDFLFLKGFKKTVADNDQIEVVAKLAGTFDYVTIAGAKKTVRAFEFGEPSEPAKGFSK